MTRRLPDCGGIKVLPPHLTSCKDFAWGDSFHATGILQRQLTLAGEQGRWLGHGAYPLKSGLIGEVCRNTPSQREDTLC